MLCRLRSLTVEGFAQLPDISEGLENRLYQAARQAGSLEEFYALVKSKRYSHARVRRLAMSAFLGVAQPSLPLALRAADFQRLGGQALSLFQLEAHAGDLYGLALPSPAPCGRDYTQGLIKVGL